MLARFNCINYDFGLIDFVHTVNKIAIKFGSHIKYFLKRGLNCCSCIQGMYSSFFFSTSLLCRH